MTGFSEKQRLVWQNTIGAHHRWNVSSGATRSGKTFLDYYRIPYRIRNVGNDGLVLLIGNTRATLERNVLSPMRGIWGKNFVGYVSQNNTIELFGRKCHALGADKISQVQRLRGAGLSYCYGDEVTTWHPEVFSMLKSRLDKKGACFDGTCNPDGPGHWFKKFLDGGESDGLDIFRADFTIDDNPFLEPDFVSALKREYAGTVYYDRYILGRWVAAEGRIYVPFSRQRHVVGLEELEKLHKIAPLTQFSIGVDIGGNKSATVFTLAAIAKGYKYAIILDEVYDKRNLTAEHVIQSFKETSRRWKDEYPRLADCYADSAEQLFVKSFRWEAPYLNVYNAKKTPVNGRIAAVNRLLAQDRLFVAKPCRELIAAIESAVWSDKEKNRDVRLDDGSVNVDSLDSMEYALEPYFTDLLAIGAGAGA